jgi:hypothetical protein
MKLGKFRSQSDQMAEQSRQNRIAKSAPQTATTPASGLISTGELLQQRLANLREHGRAIASAFNVDEQALWEEMLHRSRGGDQPWTKGR